MNALMKAEDDARACKPVADGDKLPPPQAEGREA